jgi:hypothetical protein
MHCNDRTASDSGGTIQVKDRVHCGMIEIRRSAGRIQQLLLATLRWRKISSAAVR